MGLPEINAKLKARRASRDRARAQIGRDNLAIEKLRAIRARLLTPKMATSSSALKFIAEFEGWFPAPYNDPVGHATVGYGYLLHLGRVTAADRKGVWLKGQATPGKLTQQEGRRLLARDIAAEYEPPVRALFSQAGPLHGKFTQGRFDSLVSLAFNLGVRAVLPRTHPGFETLGRALQAGDLAAIPASFALYDRAGGKSLPGLTRRRAAEAHLFRTGKYTT